MIRIHAAAVFMFSLTFPLRLKPAKTPVHIVAITQSLKSAVRNVHVISEPITVPKIFQRLCMSLGPAYEILHQPYHENVPKSY